MAKSLMVGPDDCPESWMSQPGQRQHNGNPCECVEGRYHDGECRCRCGSAPPPGKRDLVDLVQRIAVTEVRPGDVLVFETDGWLSSKELESFREGIRDGVAEDVRVMVVEHARLAGIIRHAAQPKPRCTRLDCDHMYCGSATAKKGPR